MRITFSPVSKEAEQLVPRPLPAKDVIPDWWKSIPAFKNGSAPQYLDDGSVDSTIKMCVPFADTLRFGYVQCTWMDIRIESDQDGRFRFSYPGTPNILSAREGSALAHKISPDFIPTEFSWRTQWVPKLPPGYSALITHPLNREELPFYTMSGVVDADKYHHDLDGEHPFFIKKGFTGVIPAGTPMYQIIPFKREDWESDAEPYNEEHLWKGRSLKSVFWGAYKDRFWSKKTFK